MERVLSQDERIRRAEELYYRRQLTPENRKSTIVNVEQKKESKLLKKIFIQSIICVTLYTSFYIIQNKNIQLAENIKLKLYEILNYNIDIQNLYNKYITVPQETEITAPEEITEETPEESENIEGNATTIEETLAVNEITEVEESSSISQMQEDANYIKTNYSFIKPLNGTITSVFGIRNPTTATVPVYHTGIDIAANEGTVIIAAIDGTVELVSSEGDYGNHIKITNGEVMTVYAHCKTIYIKEGEKITQGQGIAEVGATGNTTGPHLHFEIRRNNEYVDPALVLDF